MTLNPEAPNLSEEPQLQPGTEAEGPHLIEVSDESRRPEGSSPNVHDRDEFLIYLDKWGLAVSLI